MKERGQWPHDAAGAHKTSTLFGTCSDQNSLSTSKSTETSPYFLQKKKLLPRVTLFTCGVTRQLF